MGAQTFMTAARGKTAREAFQNAVDAAQYERGHGGYTGTIAEKHEFTVLRVPENATPWQYAATLMNNDDHRISDKWGPAGCVKLDTDRYLFFGWASS